MGAGAMAELWWNCVDIPADRAYNETYNHGGKAMRELIEPAGRKDFTFPRWCAVCGNRGGAEYTHLLRRVGYNVPEGAWSYAHDVCMRRAADRHKRKTTPAPGA